MGGQSGGDGSGLEICVTLGNLLSFLVLVSCALKKKKGNSNMYLIDFMLRTKIRFYVKEVATQTICPFLSWKYFLVRICPRQPPVC